MVVSEAALAFFLLPLPALAAAVAALCGTAVFLAWLVVHRLLDLPPTRGPHPPFHVGIIAIFALFLSFAAAEAWRRSDVAYGALLREAGESAALIQVLDSTARIPGEQPGALAMRAALRDYLDASLRDEWPRNVVASEAAGTALDRARAASLDGVARGGVAGAAWRVAYDRIDGVQQARQTRLVAGGLYGDALRWGGLFALFCAGAVGIALVHLDRRASVWSALGLFAAAATIALSIVAAVEHPYAGWDGVEPDRLVAVRARIP